MRVDQLALILEQLSPTRDDEIDHFLRELRTFCSRTLSTPLVSRTLGVDPRCSSSRGNPPVAMRWSHAQRDVIDWTLTEAALRGGMRHEAQAFAHERLALKPHSQVNREFLRRAEAMPVIA